MEPTIQANLSPETTGIPQGIPTGVFIPNNQPLAQTQVQAPVQDNSVQPESVAPAEQVVAVQPTQTTSATPTGPGALENFFNGLARFIAKLLGQPDPITGAPNTSQAAKKTENIVDKVWNAANKVVEKTADVASKATNVVTQATEKIQQVVPPPVAQPAASAQEQAPAAPVAEQPAQPQIPPAQ